jgi:hypothetical protein
MKKVLLALIALVCAFVYVSCASNPPVQVISDSDNGSNPKTKE